MKKLLTIVLLVASLVSTSAYCASAPAVSVEYVNETKSLQLSGTTDGEQYDAAVAFIYTYDSQIKGVASDAVPKAVDSFMLGPDGSPQHTVKLPANLVGGKYVLRFAVGEGMVDHTFMHVNEEAAPAALAQINAASDGSFMNALAEHGPACGLDPDIYQTDKVGISHNLIAYRGAGFADVNSFLTMLNQAIVASRINNGDDVATALADYASYLIQYDAGGRELINCLSDYNAIDSNARSAVNLTASSVDFAKPEGFCRVFRKHLIYEQYNCAKSWADIKDTILGTKQNKTVNNNTAIINPDMSDYSRLQDPDEVFMSMNKRKSEVTGFDKIADLFEEISQSRLTEEQNAQSGLDDGPSVSHSGGGVSTSGPTAISPQIPGTQSPAAKLSDIQNHWAQVSIELLVNKGIISGYEDGTFKPDNHVTRAEFVKMIASAFNLTGEAVGEFTDVSSDHWAYSYIKNASAAGIINGYDDGSFNPEGIITREQAAVIIYRAISFTHNIAEGAFVFGDMSTISDYALRAIIDLADAGLINGTGDGMFSPAVSTTRAQTAVLINNAIEYISAQ